MSHTLQIINSLFNDVCVFPLSGANRRGRLIKSLKFQVAGTHNLFILKYKSLSLLMLGEMIITEKSLEIVLKVLFLEFLLKQHRSRKAPFSLFLVTWDGPLIDSPMCKHLVKHGQLTGSSTTRGDTFIDILKPQSENRVWPLQTDPCLLAEREIKSHFPGSHGYASSSPDPAGTWVLEGADLCGFSGYLGDTTLGQTPLLLGSATSLLMTGVNPWHRLGQP